MTAATAKKPAATAKKPAKKTKPAPETPAVAPLTRARAPQGKGKDRRQFVRLGAFVTYEDRVQFKHYAMVNRLTCDDLLTKLIRDHCNVTDAADRPAAQPAASAGKATTRRA